MTSGIRQIRDIEITEQLEKTLLPDLIQLVSERRDGHCMRVSDLDVDLITRLSGRLDAEIDHSVVVVLANGSHPQIPKGMKVTSTKLVELRNPKADGSLNPPLLVFIPDNVKVSAEDSFGVATFEDISFGDIYARACKELLSEIPNGLRLQVQEVVTTLQNLLDDSAFFNSQSLLRFLLTVKANGYEPEVVGAALFEFGLVPDFELLTTPAYLQARLKRNTESVQKLTWSDKTERGRVLTLGLSNRAFEKELAEFLASSGVEDPRVWSRKIVLDKSLWSFAFNKWEFTEDIAPLEEICIQNVEVDLPTVPETTDNPRLTNFVNQRFLPLGKNGVNKFKVSFEVAPHPSHVTGLAKFSVQVVSLDEGPIGFVRNKGVWQGKSLSSSVTFSKLSKIDWSEGWHYIRVLALTSDGDWLPLVDDSGKTVSWTDPELGDTSGPNQSDLFYVLPESDEDIDVPPPKPQKDASVVHTKIRLKFEDIIDGKELLDCEPTEISWAESQPRGRTTANETLHARFPNHGLVAVSVPRALKNLEQRILSDPSPDLRLAFEVNSGVFTSPVSERVAWGKGDAFEEFLRARKTYFEKISDGDSCLVSQAQTFLNIANEAERYANAYLRLLNHSVEVCRKADGAAAQEAFRVLRSILGIDSVKVIVKGRFGERRDTRLLAPCHPLRALWLSCLARLAENWIDTCSEMSKELCLAAKDGLLNVLSLRDVPPFCVSESGTVFTAIENITPFWSLYVTPEENDPRGIIAELCSALHVAEPNSTGSLVDARYLAQRVKRYVIQHPYVSTLTINAFNPGRGALLSELLLLLQKDSELAHLKYDLRLFARDVGTLGLGDDLFDLLCPDSALSGDEADAFLSKGQSHLYPKLQIALRSFDEFKKDPGKHTSHLSFLFDLFPSEEIASGVADKTEYTSPVHGLIQDFASQYSENEEAAIWRRQPRHGGAKPLPDREAASDLLASLSSALSTAVSTVALGDAEDSRRPQIVLSLEAAEKALLHQLHEISDWVVTVDRNMGIEFFDHGGLKGRPDYLIDHSPDLVNSLGHKVAITSRSTQELESMLVPVMKDYGIATDQGRALTLLDQLRSLSGRLALKLISSPSQRAEALGLALSRLFLEHQGAFSNQIVVPLDSHLELYNSLKASNDVLGEEVSFKRTDLAIFDLHQETRTIVCRLVEVKCYSKVGDLAAYDQLKGKIADQISQSQEVLSLHFDPDRTTPDRVDRLLKSKELSVMLEFYLDRAIRYGMIENSAAEEARYFLRTIEKGYKLSFTRSALIFDFEKDGTEAPDLENEIEYHRIGVNLIRELVDAVVLETESSGSIDEGGGGGGISQHDLAIVERRRHRAPSVPNIEEAAFLGEDRNRSVSWEDLHSRVVLGSEEEDTPAVASSPATEESKVSMESHEPEEVAEPEQEQENKPQTEEEIVEEDLAREPESPDYDVLLGASSASPQYGILGDYSARKIALDLNQTHTISLFGVQGGGKSYTLGTVVEMASLGISGINQLPNPLASVIFHYSPTMDYKPEFTSMVLPNSEETQLQQLRETYGAEPAALSDVILLAPIDKIEERKAEYPGIEVYPIKFAANELQTSHWRFLMGAVGNQATYIRQLNRIIKSLRSELTLEGLRQGLESSKLSDHLKELAKMRLDLAQEYIDDSTCIRDLIKPGRLIIVDLRDEFIEKDEALGLFVVLLQLFADATYEGKPFNKLVVFDEAHKYIDSPDLVAGLVEVVREMRHKGTSIMVASQDPPSVPISLIELSSQVILHKFNSPAWLKHIQKANAALGALTPEKMANLRPGEAYVWSSKATDDLFTQSARKIRCRPRATQHGGATKTAVKT